ncbi:hypothetical protein D9M72_431840 [compost metagenome]
MPVASSPRPAASSMISLTASSEPSRKAVKVPSRGRSSGMVVLFSHAPLMCWYRSSCGRTVWSILDRSIPEFGTSAPSGEGCLRRWHRWQRLHGGRCWRCCSFILRTRVTVKWCAQNCFFLAAAARPQTRSSARPILVAEFVLPGHLSPRNHRKGPYSNAKRTKALRNARPPLHAVPGPDHR